MQELYRQSHKETVGELGTKGAFVILALKMLGVASAIGLLIALGFLERGDPVYKTVAVIFLSDISGLLVLYALSPIISIWKMPKHAAQNKLELEEQKQNQQKEVDQKLEEKDSEITKLKEKENQRPRIFYELPNHKEYIIKNGSAKAVAEYLFSRLLKIVRIIDGEDERTTYYVEGGSYFSPQKDSAVEYGIVLSGTKEFAVHGFFEVSGMRMTADPTQKRLPEMFIVSIAEGGRRESETALMNFDTEIEGAFLPISEILLEELRKGSFTVESIEDEKHRKNWKLPAELSFEKYSFPPVVNSKVVGVTFINLDKEHHLTDISLKLVELKKSQFDSSSSEPLRSIMIWAGSYKENFDLEGDFRIRADDKRTIRLGEMRGGEFFFLVKKSFNPERLYEEQNSGINMINFVWEIKFELRGETHDKHSLKKLFYTKITVMGRTVDIGEIIDVTEESKNG